MVRTTSGLSRHRVHDNRFRKFSRQRFHRIEPLLGPNPNPYPTTPSEPPRDLPTWPPNTAGARHFFRLFTFLLDKNGQLNYNIDITEPKAWI